MVIKKSFVLLSADVMALTSIFLYPIKNKESHCKVSVPFVFSSFEVQNNDRLLEKAIAPVNMVLNNFSMILFAGIRTLTTRGSEQSTR